VRRRMRGVCAAGLVTLAGALGGVPPAAADHVADVDCSDFGWYEDALDHLQRHPGDPDRLDRDGDGRACETLPRRGAGPGPGPKVLPPPAPGGDVFRDVLPGATHTIAIESMAAADVISGFPDGTFRPEAAVTRGQMASLLRRALDFPDGSATFSDTTGSTHRAAIAALAGAGVIQGYPDGTFRPDARITRGQMATMLVRAFDLPRDEAPGSAFRDVAGTTHESAIDTLAGTQPQPIATGFADRTFRPDATTPRGQTATFLYRAIAHTSGRAAATWTVMRVVDGDTLDARSPGGVVERVRLIGVDTPEREQCGFAEASDTLRRLTLGRQVRLVPGAADDRDGYGRLLRYVDADGTDVGEQLIRGGLAVTRYGSADGYGAHPREQRYLAADSSSAPVCPA
jgi:endonuclease YncB( thermonuclease family)